jgi:hypothetical protein
MDMITTLCTHREDEVCQILSLSNVVKLKTEEMKNLRDQLNTMSLAVSDANIKQSEMVTRFDLELSKSKEEILRLQDLLERERALLEQEKANKEKELKEMEEKMNGEFDVIELKVKRSLKILAEPKDKEIDAALTRALEAEQYHQN